MLPIDYFLASPSPLSFYSMVVSEAGIEVEREISYGPDRRHVLDVYRPSGSAGQNRDQGPIVIFLYGGGWKNGHRSAYGFAGAAFAARGFTTVIPDYRLFPEVTFPKFVEDAALAYGFVARHFARAGAQANGSRRPIVLVGHSAGAHIAALLALDRRYLERATPDGIEPLAWIGLAGPYAFDPTALPSTRPIFAGVASADVTRPVTFARPNAPATLLMHGIPDSVVKLSNMRTLADVLTKAGSVVETIEAPDVGHMGLVLAISKPFRWRAPVLDKAVDFIARHAASANGVRRP